jgi:hypothetical protein
MFNLEGYMAKQKYLTLEEKRELAIAGKCVPICIGKSSKNGFIAKLRCIFDGSLKNKTMRL